MTTRDSFRATMPSKPSNQPVNFWTSSALISQGENPNITSVYDVDCEKAVVDDQFVPTAKRNHQIETDLCDDRFRSNFHERALPYRKRLPTQTRAGFPTGITQTLSWLRLFGR